MAALAILSSYLGYDKYERAQADSAGSQSVEVNIASVPDSLSAHSHGKVYSRIEIENLIKNAIELRHEKNLVLFRKKEAWD